MIVEVYRWSIRGRCARSCGRQSGCNRFFVRILIGGMLALSFVLFGDFEECVALGLVSSLWKRIEVLCMAVGYRDVEFRVCSDEHDEFAFLLLLRDVDRTTQNYKRTFQNIQKFVQSNYTFQLFKLLLTLPWKLQVIYQELSNAFVSLPKYLRINFIKSQPPHQYSNLPAL